MAASSEASSSTCSVEASNIFHSHAPIKNEGEELIRLDDCIHSLALSLFIALARRDQLADEADHVKILPGQPNPTLWLDGRIQGKSQVLGGEHKPWKSKIPRPPALAKTVRWLAFNPEPRVMDLWTFKEPCADPEPSYLELHLIASNQSCHTLLCRDWNQWLQLYLEKELTDEAFILAKRTMKPYFAIDPELLKVIAGRHPKLLQRLVLEVPNVVTWSNPNYLSYLASCILMFQKNFKAAGIEIDPMLASICSSPHYPFKDRDWVLHTLEDAISKKWPLTVKALLNNPAFPNSSLRCPFGRILDKNNNCQAKLLAKRRHVAFPHQAIRMGNEEALEQLLAHPGCILSKHSYFLEGEERAFWGLIDWAKAIGRQELVPLITEAMKAYPNRVVKDKRRWKCWK